LDHKELKGLKVTLDLRVIQDHKVLKVMLGLKVIQALKVP
jgi:hypothetical protein